LAGPALGGLLVAGVGAGGCYLIDALTFLVALDATRRLPSMRGGGPARPGLRGVAEGLRFMAGSRPVRGALLTDLAATVLAMPISLFPLVNAERYGNDPRVLGLFLTAIGVGGVTASVFSGTFFRVSVTRPERLGRVMFGGSTVWGLALALFGVAPGVGAALALLAVAGAADTVAVVARGAVIQLHTPNALLGRVTAAEQIVGQAGPHLGNLRGGVVADLTAARTALVSGGLLCVAAVALTRWAAPPWRTPRSRLP
jgi:predicted MFS family arabinose efflux permease